MKIAMVPPHFYPYVGGGEKLFYDIARGLVKKGHEVRVVSRNVGEEFLGEKIVDGIKIKYCPWKEMFGHPFPKRKDIEETIKWCDVVHTSTFTTSPITSKLAKKYKKPSVITIHEVRGNKWYWADNFINATIFYMVEQFTCRQKFNVYHSVSNSTTRDIYRFCGKNKNVKMVYNSNDMRPDVADNTFNLRQYFGIKESDRVFLYYGRPGKTKGILVYEKALLNLVNEEKIPSDVKFCFILGKEPEDLRAKFIKLVEKKGLNDRIIIRDSLKREQLAAAIMQADCVVVPSLTEGFGFSALEACQLGTNLIYSDGGALPEVTYGKCKAFKNRDYKDLALKLSAAIEGREDAFDDVPEKNFSVDAMIEGIENIFKELTNEQ